MRRLIGALIFGAMAILGPDFAAAQGSAQDKMAQEAVQETAREMAARLRALPWQTAPADGDIAGLATIKLTNRLLFLDAEATRGFLELTGNPPRDNHFALTRFDLGWFSVFRYEPSGHVEDSEKIDPDELLAILKQGNQKGSGERRRLGLPALTLEGWSVPPHYDLTTKRLEWGTRLRADDNSLTVNYAIRILGRTGVMEAMLVSDPDRLDADLREFRAALTNFEFNPGHRYAEFRQGDKTAEYGLTALVVGGAAAAAAKSGVLGKGLFKLIAFGGLAIGVVVAFFKKLFGRA